jgi:hypothetical protein
VLALLVAVAVIFGLLAVGGYGMGWRWTGLSRSVTLWDWLQMLALPVALGLAPVLLRHRRRLTRRHHTVLGSVLGLFAVLVLLGYLVPWAWTGFTGNTLWDWLELALLPLVVGTASLWAERGWPSGWLRMIGLIGLLLFAGLVLAGYLVPWSWTGFRGNTAWDWVKLLLLPVLVPLVLIPTVVGLVTDRMAPPVSDTAGSDVGQHG